MGDVLLNLTHAERKGVIRELKPGGRGWPLGD